MCPEVILHCKDTILKIRNKYSYRKGIRSPGPNLYIHVYVSDLYIPTIGLPILLQENMWTDPGNVDRSQAHECRNWD
jgi:hypothetical protein